MKAAVMNFLAGWQEDEWKEQGEGLGFGLGAALAVMSVIAMYRGNPARMETLALFSSVMLSLAMLMPRALFLPAWVLETAFKTMTKALMYLLLILVFYIVFAPAGLVMSILGKDPLDRATDKTRQSYWTRRKPHDPKRAERQF